MARIGTDIQESSTGRTVVSSVILLILCAFTLQACENPVTLEFDTECINLGRISAVDPPGVGGYNDVFVTTGLDNPLLCGNVELGDLEFADEDSHFFEPLGDIRRRYTIGGSSAETDEAFFERAGQPENKIGLPLLGLRPSHGVWQFEAPGVQLPIRNLRGDIISFRRGDRSEGYTTQLQFSLLLDSRVRIVEVAFWRLVRESDGDGPNINREIVASWFGEQNVRVLDGVFHPQFWQVQLEDYPYPSQVVDPVFAQCDIDGRVQFRLVIYMDVVVDDHLVDNFDVNEGTNRCGATWTHVTELRNQGVVGQRGVINVYFPRSLGPCGENLATEVGRQQRDNIVIPEDQLAAHLGESGGPFVLAHELAHALGLDRVHCNEGPENLCIEGDLMCSTTQCGGGNLSQRQCQVLRNHE